MIKYSKKIKNKIIIAKLKINKKVLILSIIKL
jgi:hypothetical protein